MSDGGRRSEPDVITVRRRVRQDAPHHGGAWKIAYADFVTAMMAFFMLLWLLATPDKERLKGLAKMFSPMRPAAEAGSGDGTQKVPTEINDKTDSSSVTLRNSMGDMHSVALENDLKLAVLTTPGVQNMQETVQIRKTSEGIRIEIMDTSSRPIFNSASGDLNAYGVLVLRTVGKTLGVHGARIAIEGHTDGAGGNSALNWRLGSMRADAGRAVIESAGVRSDRIAEIVSRGSTRLAFPNDPARPENRRISVLVLDEAVSVPSMIFADNGEVVTPAPIIAPTSEQLTDAQAVDRTRGIPMALIEEAQL